MDPAEAMKWQNWFGRAAMIVGLAVVFALGDLLIAQIRKQPFVHDLLPGESVKVNGPMPERIKAVEELGYQSTTKKMVLRIERLHTGYWLGGNLWNGEVRLDQDIPPGEYRFMVKPLRTEPDETFPLFTIRVHATKAEAQRQSLSVIARILGIPPWWVIVGALPLTVLFFALVFQCARQREKLLLQRGRAEIFRIKKVDDRLEITFGLGRLDGIEAGAKVMLHGERDQPLGMLRVATVYDRSAMAAASLDCPARVGFLVSREDETGR
jgi:hypothetical protein